MGVRKNYLLIVEGSEMEPTIFNYVLSQYGFNTIKFEKKLSEKMEYVQYQLSSDKDNIFIIQGPKNRIKELLDYEDENGINIDTDSLSRLFFGPDYYFSGIFLIYDSDHNTIEELIKANNKFNNISEGLLLLSVPCVEAISEYNRCYKYEDKSYENYKKRLNGYYHNLYGLNTKEYIQSNFNEILLEILKENERIFTVKNSSWEINDVTMHPHYLLEVYKDKNYCIGNCKENYIVSIKLFTTVVYVLLSYVLGFARYENNIDLLKEYLLKVENDKRNKEQNYEKLLIENNLTNLKDFCLIADIDEIYGRYLFKKFEEKGILSKKKKGERRKICQRN